MNRPRLTTAELAELMASPAGQSADDLLSRAVAATDSKFGEGHHFEVLAAYTSATLANELERAHMERRIADGKADRRTEFLFAEITDLIDFTLGCPRPDHETISAKLETLRDYIAEPSGGTAWLLAAVAS